MNNTSEAILNQFVSFMQEEKKSENTIKNYIVDVKQFMGAHGGTGVFCPTEKAYSEFANKIKNSDMKPATINRKLMSIRMFYRFLFETNQCEPFNLEGKANKAVAVQTTVLDTRWLEPYQVRELFKAIDENYSGNIRLKVRAIFSILVNCGLRISEVRNLKRKDVDLESELMHVKGKGGKYRIVPFNAAVRKNILAWYNCEPAKGEYVFHSNRSNQMSIRGIQHFGETLEEKVNFDFTMHGLRHTALKHLADSTGSIQVVASVAGHSNINTTRRYIQPSVTEIKEAMQKTEFDY